MLSGDTVLIGAYIGIACAALYSIIEAGHGVLCLTWLGGITFVSYCVRTCAQTCWRKMGHHDNPGQKRKWGEQLWKGAVHMGITVASYNILRTHPEWLNTPASMWTADPDPSSMTHFYVAQHALWLFWGAAHILWDTRQSNFALMLLHHCVALGLVALSFSRVFQPMGVVVLYLHAVSDLFLDATKIAYRMGLHGAKGHHVAQGCMITALFAWVWYRLHMFALHIVPAAVDAPAHVCALPGLYPEMGMPTLYDTACLLQWGTACGLLLLLCCMHAYWFGCILRMLLASDRSRHAAASSN